jgi:crotonobetainyl-CoA:carnitine CoA-transferase CaiB-like acyl-CoA transferase
MLNVRQRQLFFGVSLWLASAGLVCAQVLEFPTAPITLVVRFNAAGVPCAPVNTVPEALEDAQVQALKMQSLVPGEDFVLTALPISFVGQRPEHRSVAPRLGQHNQEFNVPEPNK